MTLSSVPSGHLSQPFPDPSWADRLHAAIRRSGSVACVGLDPRADMLPPPLAISGGDPAMLAEAYHRFCAGIIDSIADLVPVVKPQAAFFEALGPAGTSVLARVIRHATDAGLLVILDGKRNDIGSTAAAYAAAYLGRSSPWGCDSLTVSPYLGDDSLEPFVAACQRGGAGIFVLVKTSNPGGGFLQDRRCDEQPLYRHVAHWIDHANASRLGKSGYGPVGAVVGATYPEQLGELRQVMPTATLLIPGFGAQGGAAQDCAAGFDADGGGAIVNSSRGIIFAYRQTGRDGTDWQQAARDATERMNDQLAAVRR